MLPYLHRYFRTSIWDETLYKAWSSIVYMLIPNVKDMESSLNEFAEILDADEVMFLLAPYLVPVRCCCSRKPHSWLSPTLIGSSTGTCTGNVHICTSSLGTSRFEKISNIIKQFKLSCAKLEAHFQSMEVKRPDVSVTTVPDFVFVQVRNSNFASFIDVFTANTYVMVIVSDSKIPSEAILINIRCLMCSSSHL